MPRAAAKPASRAPLRDPRCSIIAAGQHLNDTEMILELPGDLRRSKGVEYGNRALIRRTSNSAKHNKNVNVKNDSDGSYICAHYIALNEFGHTLGLSDHYATSGDNWDARFLGVTAIMNIPCKAGHIRQDRDIAQPDAIYTRHRKHDLQ